LLAVLLTAMVVLCSCQSVGNKTRGKRQVAPRNVDAKYDGIDISSHQGYIDWKKVSSDKDIRFVYIKATEGSTYRSPHYAHNITQARRYGLLVGSYHYLSSTSSIDEQFENFSKFALKSVQDLIPMLDVELRGNWSRSQLIDSVDKFCELTERHYGVQPMIYSTMGFYNKNLNPHFNNHHLYIGRYANEEPEINWEGEYTIWQYTETGIIPGIDAYVDLCRFRKDGWIDDILLNAE
jgi:lysozyme